MSRPVERPPAVAQGFKGPAARAFAQVLDGEPA